MAKWSHPCHPPFLKFLDAWVVNTDFMKALPVEEVSTLAVGRFDHWQWRAKVSSTKRRRSSPANVRSSKLMPISNSHHHRRCSGKRFGRQEMNVNLVFIEGANLRYYHGRQRRDSPAKGCWATSQPALSVTLANPALRAAVWSESGPLS